MLSPTESSPAVQGLNAYRSRDSTTLPIFSKEHISGNSSHLCSRGHGDTIQLRVLFFERNELANIAADRQIAPKNASTKAKLTRCSLGDETEVLVDGECGVGLNFTHTQVLSNQSDKTGEGTLKNKTTSNPGAIVSKRVNTQLGTIG